ncbi:hypothetical protein ATANTOWER_027072 [Ataeniobius toweri]|uniref:Uncharacterized protein n=1 Tax=Ataeniobius toweri TaxID=208326 RepID=A0ABU7B8W0_9TELE|nr:hypothetical protein [Ataeniobius toweri]
MKPRYFRTVTTFNVTFGLYNIIEKQTEIFKGKNTKRWSLKSALAQSIRKSHCKTFISQEKKTNNLQSIGYTMKHTKVSHQVEKIWSNSDCTKNWIPFQNQ